MIESEALALMVPPSQRRPHVWRGGVIQIWVTRACDRACFGCTQGSNLGGKPGFITLDQFEVACKSLADYWGVVGVFGGNPCIHPRFGDLCDILRNTISQEQCGLWSNHLHGYGDICRRTFNPEFSNLNVHLDEDAYYEIVTTWPEAHPVGLESDSRHSPPYVAMQDVIDDESQRWELISGCDINQHWSAMIGVFRGELRAWFCEIAGAQSMLHQHDPDYPDTGLPVASDWWRVGMDAYAHQARYHCHACGVPLRGYGELATSETGREQASRTHLDVYVPKRKGRPVEVVEDVGQLRSKALKATDYLGGARR